MTQIYFDINKVLWRFIVTLIATICILSKWAISASGLSDYLWLGLSGFCFTHLLLFTGRTLIAAIQKQPALIITDEYIFVFESRTMLTFYLSASYYWDDVQSFRKRINQFSTGVDLLFENKNSSWFTRKRNINFNISMLDADASDIIKSIDQHSSIPIPN
jgi:hypothetical protein